MSTTTLARALAQAQAGGLHRLDAQLLLLHACSRSPQERAWLIAQDTDVLAPESLAGVHIYFPDPWPKTRHHKRRLIQPPLIELLASRMKSGAYIHCATDWQHYAEQMLTVLSGETSLQNTSEGFAPRPEFRPLTKFESRGLRLGHGVWDVIFKKIG